MNTSALIMMIISLVIAFGGAIYFILKALRK
ncbi:MAG: MetS family NSS transporter small subunit [Deferribacterota bacterium]|nr:MetS family NSS transporter small subunit [Deferribacterota bacterium]